MSLKDISKTSLEDVYGDLKTFRSVVLKTYFQSPQDQLSRRFAAQAWLPIQDG